MLRRSLRTMLFVVSAVGLMAVPGFAQNAPSNAASVKNSASVKAGTAAGTNVAGANTTAKKFAAQPGAGQNRMHRHHGQHHRRMTSNATTTRMYKNAGQTRQWTMPAKGTAAKGTTAKATGAQGAAQLNSNATTPKKATNHPQAKQTKTRSTHSGTHWFGRHHASYRGAQPVMRTSR